MKDLTLFICFYCLAVTALGEEYYDDEYVAGKEYEEHYETPKFLATPQSFSVEIGDEITLPCDVEKTDEVYPLMFRYISQQGRDRMIYVDDKALGRNPRIRKEGNSFVISDVKKSDAGSYVCRFESKPVIELTHQLNVQFPAQVERVSEEILKVTQGDSVTLQCRASGNPTPAITWSKKEGHLPSGSQSEEGISITFQNADRHVEGTYICTASNGIGEPSSTTLVVQVEYPPEIITEQAIMNTANGYEAVLVCVVHGRPAPEVFWLRGDSLVSSDKHIMTHDGAHRHTLTITRVTEDDFGEYTCKANNLYGNKNSSLVLTGLPKQPEITSSPAGGEKSSYTLTWKTETFAPITQYRIKYRKVTDNRTRRGPGVWTDELFSPLKTSSVRDTSRFRHGVIEMRHPLDSLDPAEDYEAIVGVENKFGWSEFSPAFKFFTRKEIAVGRSSTNSQETIKLNGALLIALVLISLLRYSFNLKN